MAILLDIVFALSQSIPELDASVAGTGDDLPVIGTEANGENIGSVANKTAGGGTGVQVPEPEGVVPGRRKGELSIRGNDNVGNKVVVTGQDTFRVTVLVIVAGKLPHDDGLVWISH